MASARVSRAPWPLFLKAAAAAGAVMNLTNAFAASTSFAPTRMPLEKTVISAGRGRHVDTGGGYQLAHLLKADLGFATGDEACDEHTAWSLLELRLDTNSNKV